MRNRDKRPFPQVSLAASTKAPPSPWPTIRARAVFALRSGSPIHLARLIRCGRRKFSEGLAILCDGDLLPVLDPFGEPGEIVAQLADSCGFHL